MTADLGYLTLIIALAASVYAGTAFIVGTAKKLPAIARSARYAAMAVLLLTTSSMLILLQALITHNFQIEYVASHTSRDLPLPYLISALWAGSAGSLLLWAWLLSLFAVLVVLQKRKKSDELAAFASATIMLIEVSFLALLIFTANPFVKLAVTPAEGMGLSPLLENPIMIIHPPLLLAGYAGFSVPFAFAIGALLANKLGGEWLINARKWVLSAWLLLGLGNLTGAWWAYIQPGWGGYWAWDPVENAGLMPWLAATAFLHTAIMQTRRGILKNWNMWLVISVFLLTIFGTLLTRSGIVYSLHAFAESGQGVFFLVLMLATLASSLALLYWRRRELRSQARIKSVFSRESLLLLTSMLLVISAYAILLGTIFPVISQAIQGTRMTVTETFYNRINGPILFTIILLSGLCVFASWRGGISKHLILKTLIPLLVAISTGLGLFFFGDMKNWYALLSFALCGFAISAIATRWFLEVRVRYNGRRENYIRAFWRLFWQGRAHYGSYIVHIAIVLAAIGITGSSLYQMEKEAPLMPGETMTIANYSLTYKGVNKTTTPTGEIWSADLLIYKNDKPVGQLTPEIKEHPSSGHRFAQVAIHTTPLSDLYVIFTGLTSDGKATFAVSLKPLVFWLWTGGAALVLGGWLCLSSNRRKEDSPT